MTDANASTATQSFTITEPDAIVITPSQTNASCKGTANGSATAFVTGGAGNYTYQWSPSGGRNASATGLARRYIHSYSDRCQFLYSDKEFYYYRTRCFDCIKRFSDKYC
ncbi:SprB repeat-containing protein [Flavobacterium sp. P21]|uniref:SprB repeat-containing protein n=1 Tax=Flavobacterium sp. P21 TaxID=3423948 RepID=UPI003D6678F4